MNRNIFATINRNEYKDVMLNNKCLMRSTNRIQINIIEYELMNSLKFHCLVLMPKYISKTMDMFD